jgi:putative transposase
MNREKVSSLAAVRRAASQSWENGETRLWKRLKAIQMHLEGIGPDEICRVLDVSRRSVFYWAKRFHAAGLKGLDEGLHSGRPKQLSTAQLDRLGKILDEGPLAYGFSSKTWTCVRVGQVIQKEFGVAYHEDHVRKILHQLGFSVRRRKKGLTRTNSQSLPRWVRETYRALEKPGVLVSKDRRAFAAVARGNGDMGEYQRSVPNAEANGARRSFKASRAEAK